ncbi:hypothetical protein EN851_08325 [Mesorhizobium sp. M8A.F.Ca.ET.208.01.1.1]|uniref:hypothetical protein n=1 Tax=unclassified Mesorhizobium TaxID=325217 RepID=UPI000FE7A09E|nr:MULTISPECIES: hypothetical protein [unclassified Mesorhizobium]RWC68677.1 MAG: hypothetical protein EOS71_30000 [Mesorhizobium sp.]TGP95922.1 hypothetical protein EN861_13680 [Mesorhizobium sp. M8A.F.Ca.ET.218.01.1.1]TGQ95512.1 hypothetical protein EN851_08325 [Mesorhizobium sp. M8A.F.Ca.ET.208.01.1.1]TGT18974.1 hypothetical protein EN856_13695 [Mesorhizobium sp. M8A.F.Ca.ET.213.01.1.1]TIU51938.1 MAG: hypothetical protein E5W19_02890 [Mesorhizobium sp.]
MFQVAARLTVPRPITKSRLPNFAGWARNPAFLLRSVMYPQGWIDNATPAETAPVEPVPSPLGGVLAPRPVQAGLAGIRRDKCSRLNSRLQ